ncbi:hypothetical protein O9G_006268 [Rozella allomycis CSF55]|uniref:Uncharacterized protein n=1 Tax=Rozella allomycis (strain CSF55) TaxID=988480 RepID=A0A075B4F8_ROZAC|nr:hypothetical protein O9G_006268 [Rozella allomycis CSF55]|eukprot:EPZ36325.1 hypothetical protein O9G_006268 [Rozella allomycis CSF55]
MKLEAISSAAFVLASRSNGLGGITLNNFMRVLVYELSIKDHIPDSIRFPLELESFGRIIVPFLSVPNVEWPLLNWEGVKMSNFTRTRNDDQIDCKFPLDENNIISIEVNNRIEPFGTPLLESSFKNIPCNSKIHFIVLNKLVRRFYPNFSRKSYSDFLSKNQNLAKKYVYKLTKNGLESVSGIQNSPDCVPGSIVIFVPLYK